MTDDDFDAFTSELEHSHGEPAGTAAPQVAPVLFYGSADEFVRKYLRFQYRRVVGGPGRGACWQAAWWENEEAVSRIEALWRTWEAARRDSAAAVSDWWLNHCDRHMQVLLSDDGPFARSTDTSRAGEPLPYTPPPTGWFPPDAQPPS